MKKREFLRPQSNEFTELMNNNHEEVRDEFRWYLNENDVLAYSTLHSIVFYTKELVKHEWNKFCEQTNIEYGLEQTIFDDEYIENFALFIFRDIPKQFEPRYFSHIMEYIFELYDETNKWRLPTIDELRAMHDIENNKSISGFISVSYWSSTTHANNHNGAWLVDFLNGGTDYYNKEFSKCVRCVREAGDGILELSPSSDIGMTHNKAIEYARNLVVKDEDIIKVKLNGLLYEEIKDETNKWRLPTINELKSMHDIESNKGISGFVSGSCWSSTTYACESKHAWTIVFNDGVVDWTSKVSVASVRCVRELEDGILELSPSSKNEMNYYEAIEYARSLYLSDEDIIKIKLDGLLYKEIKNEN